MVVGSGEQDKNRYITWGCFGSKVVSEAVVKETGGAGGPWNWLNADSSDGRPLGRDFDLAVASLESFSCKVKLFAGFVTLTVVVVVDWGAVVETK